MASSRLFHPEQTAHRLAVVTVQPHVDGEVHVAVARGPSRLSLTDHKLYGPFPAAAAAAHRDEIVAALRADGYVEGGLAALVATVATSKSPKDRAHAAERLGWRRDLAAVAVLRTRAEHPKDDISAVVTALGRIGDPSALPVIHAEATRKLLSRRRAGSEALRAFGDVDSRRVIADAATARLPSSVQAALDVSVPAIVAAVKALPKDETGPAIDALYDLGSVVAVEAVRALVVDVDFTAPGTWRFVRSVLKRAMVRLDGDTAGPLFRLIDIKGRTAKGGTLAKLKSGLDGEVRATRVFSERTAAWHTKASWRWLTRIAKYRPERYADIASACLIPWRDADDIKPRARVPATGRSFLLLKIAHGGSIRFEVDRRRAVIRLLPKAPKAVPGQREEPFASIWNEPSSWPAVRRLLGGAQHRLVTAFALRLAEAFPAIVDDASVDELAAMLRLDGPIAARALALLQQRLRATFDAAVIARLGASEAEQVRALATSALTANAHRWTRDVDASIAFVLGPPAIREAATRLLLLSLPSTPTALRAAFVERIVALLDVDLDDDDGRFDGIVELVDALGAEIRARVTIADALRLLARNTAGAAVAAVVVAAHAGAVDVLGLPVLLGLAAQPTAARRSIAVAAITVDAALLRERLGLVLELAEGEWDDVRAACVEVLRGLPASTLDIDTLTAIIDSTWPTVQETGKHLVTERLRHASENNEAMPEVLARLAQHPHRALRRFVIDLATSTLRPGYVALLRLEPMIRAVLFDLRPDVALRHDVTALLKRRGVADEAQAELVISIARDVMRSRTHALRDDALMLIAVMTSTYPHLAAGLVDDTVSVAEIAA